MFMTETLFRHVGEALFLATRFEITPFFIKANP